MLAAEERRILVVDDSDDAIEHIEGCLEPTGYSIATARNGRDALVMLLDGPSPDAIIVDLVMPVMDGWELLALVRAYSRLARIPVLIISATQEAPATLRRYPGTAFLAKPFRAEELCEALHRLIGGKPTLS